MKGGKVANKHRSEALIAILLLLHFAIRGADDSHRDLTR